jgi:hypothetical protein
MPLFTYVGLLISMLHNSSVIVILISTALICSLQGYQGKYWSFKSEDICNFSQILIVQFSTWWFASTEFHVTYTKLQKSSIKNVESCIQILHMPFA